MRLQSVIVLLLGALLNVKANVKEPQRCNGGFCLPMHLCPTGIANDELKLFQQRLLMLRADEENECGDFMKICCKESSRNSRGTDSQCGISNPQGLVYSVESNLTYARYAEYPWTVAIFEKSSSSNNPELTHVGAGTLIHPKFVLMTAHTCKDLHQYVARFGEWNMESTAEIYPVQEIEIMETIKHPQYRPGNLPGNDIGLAVLRGNVIYSEHIRPICLPNADDNFEDQKCISSGWGLDVRTGKPPALMKRMELEIISHARCQMLYWLVDSNIKLDFTTMCVKGTKGQYTAKKDGGSPLACERDDGSYVLAGIASWGVITYSQQSEFPTGQMDVTKFVGWINDTINSYDGWQAKTDNRIQFLGRIERMPVLYANPHQESKGR